MLPFTTTAYPIYYHGVSSNTNAQLNPLLNTLTHTQNYNEELREP